MIYKTRDVQVTVESKPNSTRDLDDMEEVELVQLGRKGRHESWAEV
jgi:hypothetical protein